MSGEHFKGDLISQESGSAKHSFFQGKSSWNLTFLTYVYTEHTHISLSLRYPSAMFPC